MAESMLCTCNVLVYEIACRGEGLGINIGSVDDLMKGVFINCVGVSSPASVEAYISAY